MHPTILIVAVIFSIIAFRIQKEIVSGNYLGGHEDEGNRLIFMLNTPEEDSGQDILYEIRETNFSGRYLFVVDNSSDDRFGKFKIISTKDINKEYRNKAKKGKTLVRLRNSFIIKVH